MILAPEPFASRRDTVAFAVCLLLGVGFRVAPPSITQQIASALRSTILAPFLAIQRQTELFQSSRVDFARVVAERDSIALLTSRVASVDRENERLRSILGLRSRLPVQHVAAEVLHQAYPTERFDLIVSRGRRDGVLQWAPVIAPAGLIGHVETVDRETAVVLSWAHPEFRVSATALDGAVVGIVAPRTEQGRGSMLELRGVPYLVQIPTGTPIRTSGLGGVYPRGIPIGRVVGIAEEQEGWSRTYLVEPAVHPGAVSHALILLAEAPNLRAVFPPPER